MTAKHNNFAWESQFLNLQTCTSSWVIWIFNCQTDILLKSMGFWKLWYISLKRTYTFHPHWTVVVGISNEKVTFNLFVIFSSSVCLEMQKRRCNTSIMIDSSHIEFSPKTAYFNIMQRLIRRYLFQIDREKNEQQRGQQAGESLNYNFLVLIQPFFFLLFLFTNVDFYAFVYSACL